MNFASFVLENDLRVLFRFRLFYYNTLRFFCLPEKERGEEREKSLEYFLNSAQ